MAEWIDRVLRLLGLCGGTTDDARRLPSLRRSYPTIPLAMHRGDGRTPPMHWKPSHPSTIRRFKAEVTCARGHAIALRDHSVEADGRVVPSIVCNAPGCDFHEIVRLEGWSAGQILSPVAEAMRKRRA